MRRFLLITALLSACKAAPPHLTEVPATALPELTPASVAPPAVEWHSIPDFTSLREAYAPREDFFKRCEVSRPGKAFMAKVNAKDLQGAADVALSFLQQCPVDAQVHLWRAKALRELGQVAEADVHMKWFLGLTDSAMKTGDGQKPETAYVTISVAEEYAILARLREQPVRQALIQGPTALDALTARDENGKESTVYFNPRWHFIRLAHMFPESKK